MRAVNGYTRNITTTLVASSTFRAASMAFSLGFMGRIWKGEKRKRSTRTSGCRVTERGCGWLGRAGLRVTTAGEASRRVGMQRGRCGEEVANGRGRSERTGGPSRQSVVLRRGDEIATRNDVVRSNIRASTVTWYKDCTRFVLHTRYTCHDRGFSSVLWQLIVDHSRLTVREACFPGCATVRCYPRFSIFRIPRFDWSISLCTTRPYIDIDGSTTSTVPRQPRRPIASAAQSPIRLKESYRNTSWNREWNLLINILASCQS